MVRELHAHGVHGYFSSDNAFYRVWNLVADEFLELDTLLLGGHTKNLLQEGIVLRPNLRLRRLEICTYTEADQAPEMEPNQTISLFPDICPNLTTLKLSFLLSDWRRNSRERTAMPSKVGLVNLNPLTRLGLEELTLVFSAHYTVTPACMSEWPDSRIADSLRVVKLLEGRNDRSLASYTLNSLAARTVVAAFIRQHCPNAIVLLE